MKRLFIKFLILAIVAFNYITLSSAPVSAATKEVPNSKEQINLSFAPLVKKASPAVVNIYTKKRVKVQAGISPFFNDPYFSQLFGNMPGGMVTERIENSLGSGVIVKSDGLIVTNNHVIAGGEAIQVVLHDKREYAAKLILTDQKTDLAVLKIDTSGDKLDYLEMMDSDSLEVGDMVLAIGNPFGVGQTVTSGIVSALARATVGISSYEFFIQTDAAINPGNSGGALVNMEGKLAGINTAIVSKSGGSQGIGFAIPANMVATVINSNGGKVVRPWLGISAQIMTAEIATSLGLKAPKGALISEVRPNSAAADAGLMVGDVVLMVDNHEIEDENSLNFRIATYSIGSEANFKILRKGEEKIIKVKMKAAPETTKRDFHKLTGHNLLSGATIANLSPALSDELGIKNLDKGVIVVEVKEGNAALLGVKAGDLLLKANEKEITSAKQAESVFSDKKITKWNITVQRGAQIINIMYSGRF